jgi:mannose-6-phosphate isomerase-like protein (cupin superfamily)
MYLDGQAVELRLGSVVFVPAGVRHGFENTSNSRWLVRATIYRRVYARQAIRRAITKRLERIRRGWLHAMWRALAHENDARDG